MRRGMAARFGSRKKEMDKKKKADAVRLAERRRNVRAEAVDIVEDELWLIVKGVLCALSWLMFMVFSILWCIDKRGKKIWIQFWYASLLCVFPTSILLIWPSLPSQIVQDIRNWFRW
eukprot:CAMPEP_0181300328 /NCGR_PEP_ID=MMETSP1101-20121128/6829_1 /TAXON_ID=46948 /ORGANISM="Rhodomonas abbreviata, Strain Caron Lab Isolate" /LENGTH=116 /DNA_ID=CAMNT_0023405553 /DNA_START=354 /DNA_END=701 /DNA_ORIENTATION=-